MSANEATLAGRLKSRRKELGLSQNELAKSCGVSQPTIANWERGGHVPRQAALASIALGLDVDPLWLLSGLTPSDKSPAHLHLTKPIRNIPIFGWPAHVDDLKTAQAQSYVTLSMAGDDMLAIIAPCESDFPDGTILIFDTTAPLEPGLFLVQDGEIARLKELSYAANDDEVAQIQAPIGRLVLSLQPH